MKGLAVPLGAVAPMLLWIGVIAPVLARAVGVPMRMGLWTKDRDKQGLSNAQILWAYGVFASGGGLFLFLTVWDYLKWTLMGDQFSRLSAGRVALKIAEAVLAGLIWGLIGLRHRGPE